MKKSTLITTIAMIVVVVVALSTATYAWFSSQTTSTAKTTITTSATSGWTLSQGNVNDSAQVTFSSQSTSIDLATQGLTAGLFSPNAAIAAYPTSNAATQVYVKDYVDAKVTEGKTATAVPSINFYACQTKNGDAYVTTANTAKKPTVIRVVNNNGSSKECTVTVLIVLQQDNQVSRYGAAAMTFYFADGAGNIYTLGYQFKNATGKAAVDVNGYKYTAVDTSSITAGSDVSSYYILKDGVYTKASGKAVEGTTYYTQAAADSTDISASKVEKPTASEVVELSNVKGNVPTYDTATAAGSSDKPTFKTATAEKKVNDDITISSGQTYLTYTFTISGIADKTGVNLVNYTWMNGWTATDEAAGATVDVYYVFGDAIALPSSTDAKAV